MKEQIIAMVMKLENPTYLEILYGYLEQALINQENDLPEIRKDKAE